MNATRLTNGLQWKRAATAVLLLVPVAIAVAWWAETSILTSSAAVLTLALLIDSWGRLQCLSSGIGSRTLVFSSVICQCLGLCCLLAFGLAVPDFGVFIGLLFAFGLQFLAAMFFTSYLRSIAGELQDDTLVLHVDRLRRGVIGSLTALTVLQIVALIVAIILGLLAMLTAGYGLLLGIPAGLLALFPVTLIVLWVVGSMLARYDQTLRHVIQRISSRETMDSSGR